MLLTDFAIIRGHPMAIVSIPAAGILIDEVPNDQRVVLVGTENQRFFILIDVVEDEPDAVKLAFHDFDVPVEVALRVGATLFDISFEHTVIGCVNV